MEKTTIIEFPCYFPIKVIGNNSTVFLEEIREITVTHFPNITEDALTHKMSKDSNYLAITVTVYAENQDMLDAFYRAITQHPDVKMVL
ncbi:HP0495 family protein [Legionella sp. WA2022007384]